METTTAVIATIEEKNKAIAEFMGFEMFHHAGELAKGNKVERFSNYDEKPFFGSFSAKQLIFDSSWKWLMYAVEKIESMKYMVEIYHTDCDIKGYESSPFLPKDNTHGYFICTSADTKLLAVHEAVYQFVKLFKSNSTK